MDLVESQHDMTGSGLFGGSSINRAAQPLPEPVFSLEAPLGDTDCFTAAFGTKILALLPMESKIETRPLAPLSVIPVIDVVKRSLTFIPRPNMDLLETIYIPMGNRLFALSSGSFRMLSSPEVEEVMSWCKLPKQPFKRRHVSSYSVHPDGRTIFVSTQKRGETFTFDTSGTHFEWKRREGKWVLPFTGRAFYDGKLDAWVGLSGDPGKNGHICACDVLSPNPSAVQCLAVKISKEKLFGEDPAQEHVGINLVYMGGTSRFCLVQCVSVEDDEDEERNFYKCHEERSDLDDYEETCKYFLRLTSFSLKFDKDGALTTGDSRRVRYYQVPEGATGYSLDNPAAFWM